MKDYTFSERPYKDTGIRIDVNHEDKNVAYIRAQPQKRGDYVFIHSLYVNPKYRRQNLSGELLNKVIKRFKNKEIRLEVDPFRDKPLTVNKLKNLYSAHGFKSISRYEMSREPKEKNAGGDILGRLTGLVSRPFIGAQKSQNLQNKVVSGITNYVNKPIESGLRRTGVHKAISKAYEVGSTPIPGTPKLVQPIMPSSAQRRAYGNWRADDIVHTISNNPEIIGGLAIPVPGMTTSYLAGKQLASRALGIKKLAAFSDELVKLAQVRPIQQEFDYLDSFIDELHKIIQHS